MNLISLNGVSLRYGAYPLLDAVELYVAEGDRLAIIGRNGCGKTSLMKIIAGIIDPDSGLVEKQRGVTVAYLPQEVPTDLSGTVYSVVASGLGHMGEILSRYHKLLTVIEGEHSNNDRHEFDAALHELNENDAWSFETKIAETIERLELNPASRVEALSAGLKRRVLLGKGLVSNPDILILDEPTNHLDLDSVLWLEKFLRACGKTLIFVSHDRAFLQGLATRVLEVDRGRLVGFSCDIKTFIERRDDLLRAQEQKNAVFDKKLAQEEAWLRQGVKARRTRNEGRVRELMELRKIRQARRARSGQVNMQIQEGQIAGQKVMDVKSVSVSYSDKKVIDNFSTTIFRGDKIGIIGRNGAGKTTLLNALLGKIKVDSGEIVHGTHLQIAYFDQLRRKLDPKLRLCDFVGDGTEFVTVNGQKQNIVGYMQNFLFSPEQLRGEIGMLSGGERNRLLLAMLFTQPANVLVLDEPTNDLDMETLDMLEAKLVDFPGTILLVSHDRTFLNNIVTGLFGFEENGEIKELVGGYDEWEKYKNGKSVLPAAPEKKKKPRVPSKEKFTNKEAAELEAIPAKIDALERELEGLASKLQDPDFIRNNPESLKPVEARISEIEKEDEILFARWSYLEERKKELGT